MQRQAWVFAMLAAACALALGACSEQADTNANAPGSPGSGNATEVVRPAAPDGPPGGPSGIAGSQPHPGSSGGDAVRGITGNSTGQADSRSAERPGVGLDGGLASSAGSTMGAAPPPPGSTNTTPSNTVGQR